MGFPSRVLTGEAFDAASFSYPLEPFGLDLGLMNSPGDLVLTALAVLCGCGSGTGRPPDGTTAGDPTGVEAEDLCPDASFSSTILPMWRNIE